MEPGNPFRLFWLIILLGGCASQMRLNVVCNNELVLAIDVAPGITEAATKFQFDRETWRTSAGMVYCSIHYGKK